MLEEREIAAEMQYAPAPSFEAARDAAARVVAVRKLLEARARELNLLAAEDASETASVDAMEAVLEAEVEVPEATEADCRAWFDAHPGALRSPDLLEASHILFAAAPDDAEGRARALADAKAALAEIERAPERFEAIAREKSACVRSPPEKLARRNRASMNRAARIRAWRNTVPTSSARVKSASVRSAPESVEPFNFAPMKSAPRA